MNSFPDEEELPLLLVARATERHEVSARPARAARAASPADALERHDRVRPATAGVLAGALAGAAVALVVRALEPHVLARLIATVQARAELGSSFAQAVAYALVALVGAILGACFAVVTRHLRRFFPLLFWALVFFPSLALLAQAAARAYLPAAGEPAIRTLLAASVAFACVVSLQLPVRRRAR